MYNGGERTDPIWGTEYDLPEIMLEAIDRELELLECSKLIEADRTTVISVFKNVPPAADGTIYTEVALNTAKALWDAGITPSVLYNRDENTGAESTIQRSVDVVKAFQLIVSMCGLPRTKVERSGGEGNLAAAVAEPGISTSIDLNAMDDGPVYNPAPDDDGEPDEVDYDPDDIEMESRAGDMDLSNPQAEDAEISAINFENPVVHPKDVWYPGVTTQPRLNAKECPPCRTDCDKSILISFFTRSFPDFATARENNEGPCEPMLSYDLTARHTVPGKGQERTMDHLFNCRGAKANNPTYEPIRWKTVRCYDGRTSHDADPWRPDPTSMRLNVPNHKIDLNRP